MTRSLVIQTMVKQADGSTTEPKVLEPGVHAALYNIPEIREAREFITSHPSVEGVWVRVGARAYSLIVYLKPVPNSFDLGD